MGTFEPGFLLSMFNELQFFPCWPSPRAKQMHTLCPKAGERGIGSRFGEAWCCIPEPELQRSMLLLSPTRQLLTMADLDDIVQESSRRPVMVFKHSTT